MKVSCGLNNDMKISVGKYEVYDSGSVLSHGNKDILFEIKNLKVRIKFVSDPENANYDAKISLIENNTCLLLTLVNFNNSLGTGLTNPVEIGTINGSRLYLQFVVYRLGESDTRMFSYTWLTRKEG